MGDDDDPPDFSERRLRSDRRSADRFEVVWSVDCETDETFLYASITNISELGIFVRTNEPLQVGTRLTLRFSEPRSSETFVLSGVVQWVNPLHLLAENLNPGMGIRFVELAPDERERIVDIIRTIAYVRDAAKN
ncbi:MAG: TIGR02266 family protein [Myxococcales bacterium]|nr:TIGR02266 family protein [Myxococcales bacterium]